MTAIRHITSCVFLASAMALAGGSWAQGSGQAPALPGATFTLADGRSMHLNCTGDGSPTVILESGLGALGAVSWVFVQPEISSFTRVCTYSQAGATGSDPGPLPRDGAHIATDLHELLRAAGEQPPYVLVGHSRGGMFVRIYAAHYPDEVTGLVLVDPSVPGQFDVEGAQAVLAEGSAYYGRCLAGARAGEMQPDSPLLAECAPYLSTFPPPVVAQLTPSLTEPSYWEMVLSVYESFDADTAEVAARERLPYTMPVLVLTAAERDPGITSAMSDEEEQTWFNALQGQIASISTRGEHRLIERASHQLQIDRPDAVIQAVQDVIAAQE